ncbi:MAG: bifunctional folylpolyglutamate synthase/dihydrofolate synthase [Candidatus Omnitrophica bacterium]|nr:bifunctional folylpolyglutamate synthase/dihydrofolate synthase [Candidatus Omnitrophota bacterium]
MPMTYQQAIDYLESFINYEKVSCWSYKDSLKLERIKEFLNLIGRPQDNLRYIHIAGTKGKGSTCAFITYILREAGFKVGLYTSPHLSDFRERIRILKPLLDDCYPLSEFEGMISEEEVLNLVELLRPSIEDYNKHSKYGPLSFFEVYTSMAFVYFMQKRPDFVVLETGLGGRLDATNVVNPLVCAITPISYEHTQKLGTTLKEIAWEKAGIIKTSNSIVICAPQEKEVLKVIRGRCKETKTKLYEVNKDIFFEKRDRGFNILGIFGEYPHLEINLLGDHQLVNATVAVGVVEALRFYNIIIDSHTVKKGLYRTIWPGRCEIIFKNPFIVLDGAQNVASASALKETIKGYFRYKRLVLVLGISKDKDIRGICQQLNTLADIVILTKANNPRAIEPKILADYFKNKSKFITPDVKTALEKARVLSSEDDLILITGSLFVVGEARDYLIKYLIKKEKVFGKRWKDGMIQLPPSPRL